MASGWGTYYVVFLSALMGLVFPFVLGLASFLVSPRDKRPHRTLRLSRPEVEPQARINTRIFLGTNVATLLIALTLVLIPCVAGLGGFIRREPVDDPGLPAALVVGILSVVAFLSLGLLYAARKGDLAWLSSRRDRPGSGEGEE
jgi:hypothetical protein